MHTATPRFSIKQLYFPNIVSTCSISVWLTASVAKYVLHALRIVDVLVSIRFFLNKRRFRKTCDNCRQIVFKATGAVELIVEVSQ
jgi:hypothetical protein